MPDVSLDSFYPRSFCIVEDVFVELVFAAGNHKCHDGVTGNVDCGAQHVEQTINANDQCDAFDGEADLH